MQCNLPKKYGERKRFPHQKLGTVKAKARGNMGFWMEMRTGKTLTCLDTIVELGAFPCLIMGPIGVLPGWVSELKNEGFTDDEIQVIRPTRGKVSQTAINKAVSPSAKFNLINYEIVRDLDILNIRLPSRPVSASGVHTPRIPVGYGVPNWESVVYDESYRLANPESKITGYLLSSPRPSGQKRYMLCGSPASEAAYNFCTQYLIMDGIYFGCTTAWEYMTKYWEWSEYTHQWRVKDIKHLEDVREFVQTEGYCVTMKWGAKIFYEEREVMYNPAQKKLFDWLQWATVYEQKHTGQEMLLTPVVRCGFEHKVASGVHPLTDEVISETKIRDVIEYYKAKPHPILILNQHKALVALTAQRFREAGFKAAHIDGDVKKGREQIRLDFQSGKLDIVSAQIGTVKVGQDFSQLDTLWFMSNSWSHDDRSQAEKRGDKVNKSTPYLIVDQQTHGSCDTVLTKVLTKKKKDAKFYIEEMNNHITHRNSV